MVTSPVQGFYLYVDDIQRNKCERGVTVEGCLSNFRQTETGNNGNDNETRVTKVLRDCVNMVRIGKGVFPASVLDSMYVFIM